MVCAGKVNTARALSNNSVLYFFTSQRPFKPIESNGRQISVMIPQVNNNEKNKLASRNSLLKPNEGIGGMQELPQTVRLNTRILIKTKSLFESHLTSKLKDSLVQTKNTSRYIPLRLRYNRKTLFDNVNSYYKNNYSIETKRPRKLNSSQVLLSKIIKKENTNQLLDRKISYNEIQLNENYFQFRRVRRLMKIVRNGMRV